MASTSVYKCSCCKKDFTARVADRKRGWARYCSKSCKAKIQTLRTGYAGPENTGGGGDDGFAYLDDDY